MRRLLAVAALGFVVAACGDDAAPEAVEGIDPVEQACAAMQAHIELLLGPKFKGPVPVEVVDIDFIAKFAADLEEKMIPPGFADTARRLAVRMKVVPKGFDVHAAQIELVKLMVVGLYDPLKDRFYLVKERGTPGLPEFAGTLAHELVHAYRDIDKQYFEKTLAAVMVDADKAIAISCLTEGDATLLGQALGPTLGTARSPEEFLKLIASRADVVAASLGSKEAPPELQKFPYGLREMFLGRYMAGLVFASKVYEAGGLKALDAAFSNPPRSTEQVLHPEKYTADEPDEPTIFSGGNPAAALGEGWKASMSNTFGEFEMRVHFTEKLGRDEARKAAAGWDGARYYFCEKEGEPSFVGLITTWDTEDDAKEFERAWNLWAGVRDGKAAMEAEAERRQMLVRTNDGLVAVRATGKDVLVADGVPRDRVEAVFAALASATRK